MSIFLSEFIGTAALLLFGVGVCANTSLKDSYAKGGGWIVIAFGWAMAVFVGVYIAAPHSGAHLNPAVTIALAILGKIPIQQVPTYIIAQTLGAMAGAYFAWLTFRLQYDTEDDPETKLGTFCTAPAIHNIPQNLASEAIGTFALVFGVLFISAPKSSLGALDALPVALLVFGIGLSLGGATGYAINPARDFGPRLMHYILPIRGKGHSNWAYAWVPIFGPICGAILAAATFIFLGL